MLFAIACNSVSEQTVRDSCKRQTGYPERTVILETGKYACGIIQRVDFLPEPSFGVGTTILEMKDGVVLTLPGLWVKFIPIGKPVFICWRCLPKNTRITLLEPQEGYVP